MEEKIRIIEKCWEIVRACEKFDTEHDCPDDLIGDVEANVSDILFYLIMLADHNDIGALLRLTVKEVTNGQI